MSRIIARPLASFPPPETPANDRLLGGAFRATIGSTLDELHRELDMIGVKQAVLELDLSDSDCRRDGGLRADASPRTPRVVLSFTHPVVGEVRYPCDRYRTWQHNVRGIRLSLEALRAVDRHGVTRQAEQYRGWTALPAQSSAGLNVAAAARVLVAYSPASAYFDATAAAAMATEVMASVDVARAVLRLAAKATHPDTAGGSHEQFTAVQDAKRTLCAHFNVGTL